MLKDSFERVHNYLRISLTDNCNLRCFYCMPEEDLQLTRQSHLMTADEIVKIARVFVSEGVTKIRLTGGEPLVRKDAEQIIRLLATLPIELTLTTNGTRLNQYIDILKGASVRTINISLDTLQADKFARITRRDQFGEVMQNIRLCLLHHFNVKINVVVMQGMNDDEIVDFIEWTKDLPVEVRFIEFMPFSGNRWTSNQVLRYEDILEIAAKNFEFDAIPNKIHDTSKKFKVPGYAGSFGVISTMSAHFCGDCNRMRLTADGKLKNCLFSESETDLLSAVRNGVDIVPLIHKNIFAKKAQQGGQLAINYQEIQAREIRNRSMIRIGG